jgi:hypothetical protein
LASRLDLRLPHLGKLLSSSEAQDLRSLAFHMSLLESETQTKFWVIGETESREEPSLVRVNMIR